MAEREKTPPLARGDACEMRRPACGRGRLGPAGSPPGSTGPTAAFPTSSIFSVNLPTRTAQGRPGAGQSYLSGRWVPEGAQATTGEEIRDVQASSSDLTPRPQETHGTPGGQRVSEPKGTQSDRKRERDGAPRTEEHVVTR